MYIVAPLFEAPTKIVLDKYTFHSRVVIPGCYQVTRGNGHLRAVTFGNAWLRAVFSRTAFMSVHGLYHVVDCQTYGLLGY